MISSVQLDKDRMIISNPEQYESIEIRSLTYDDGEGLSGGYNGNVIIGYMPTYKDIFFLTINAVSEDIEQLICGKVEDMFGQDGKLINLMIYNGDSTIYYLNDNEQIE